MRFRFSLLFLLFSCCINVASTRHTKNLRKSLNQKFGDHGLMDDSPYPVDSDDDVPTDDVEYKNVGSNDDKHPIVIQDEIQHNGYGDGGYGRNEVAATEPNDLMDDSSSNDRAGQQDTQKLNETQNGYGNFGYGRNVVPAEKKRPQDHGLMDDSSSDDDIGKQNPLKINEIFGKQLEDILGMFQKSKNLNGENEIPAKKKQSYEHSPLSSDDDNHGKQKHGRFRREYTDSDGVKHSDGEAFVGGVLFWLIICFLIFFCCCLPGITICVVLSRR